MKEEDKSGIVRLRDGIPVAQFSGTAADTSQSEQDSNRTPWLSAPYGGPEPIRVTFPWRPFDTLIAYFAIPACILFFVLCAAMVVFGVCRGWGEFAEKIQNDPTSGIFTLCALILLGCAGITVLPGVFVYIWYLRFYRKKERSITVDPATNTFRISNYVIGGKRFLPAFHEELIFKLDDVQKIYFGSPGMNAFFLEIPEGILLVGGKTAGFARMKYYLVSEAQEKLVQTGRRTMDGAPTMENF